MITLLYVVLALVALGILVFFHELGHYLMARWVGMRVEVFSIGFGRPLVKWRVGEVDWQVGILPFGGYVRIAGMDFAKQAKDPYAVSGGFFTKSPLARIAVALAGPVANFLVALLLFTLLFFSGGRDKPFSEFTHYVGWVDPTSPLFQEGMRAGDELASYNGHPYTSSKDLIYAALFHASRVTWQGWHQQGGERTAPFSYTVAAYPSPTGAEGMLTTGVLAPASYLFYRAGFPGETPLEGSGIQPGDRLLWAEGVFLYSVEQLNALVNDSRLLLTVRRGDRTFLSRQPRVRLGDMAPPLEVRDEYSDLHFSAKVKGRLQQMWVLPYILSEENFVERPLPFIDLESRLEAFPVHSTYPQLEEPLEVGDRIVAIGGLSVSTLSQLVSRVQKKQIRLIVERQGIPPVLSWKRADAPFFAFSEKDLRVLERGVGLPEGRQAQGSLLLLEPVEPKRLEEFPLTDAQREAVAQQFAAEEQRILRKSKDPTAQASALQQLELQRQRLILGLVPQDAVVSYNPQPLALFGSLVSELWQTLRALFTGSLSPKWIGTGPVGIVQVLYHSWRIGFGEACFWVGAISLNLGLLNLLPIPVLDGGYITLSLWEWITRRHLKPKTMERIVVPFVVLLVGLLVFLTFQDIKRFF